MQRYSIFIKTKKNVLKKTFQHVTACPKQGAQDHRISGVKIHRISLSIDQCSECIKNAI